MTFHLLDVRTFGALCGSRSGPVVSSPLAASIDTCALCLELWEMYGKSEAAALGGQRACAELQRFDGPPPPELPPELACPERLFDWVKCNGERGHAGWHWSWAFGLSWGPTPPPPLASWADSWISPGNPCPLGGVQPCACVFCRERRERDAGGNGSQNHRLGALQNAEPPSSLTRASGEPWSIFAARVASVLTGRPVASNRPAERASGTPTSLVSWIQPLAALRARGAAAWGRARGTLRELIRRAALKGWN